MAIPAGYTEETLAQYMYSLITNDDAVNEFATALRWSVANGSYQDAVDEAIAAYGVDDITAISGRENIRRLRAVARVELWRSVVQRTVPSYQVSDGTTTTSRNQLYEHAKEMYDMALNEAITLYGVKSYLNARPIPGGEIGVQTSVV